MAKSIIIELLLLIISLSIQKTKCNIFKKILNIFKAKDEENFLNIFIATHKDFQNYRYNPVYKIIANDPSQLKNKYNLEVIYCDLHNEIKDMDNAYAEMSRIYHIYNLYKTGKMSSKYIGFNHYRRYFPFLDNIPDLDEIFLNYDIIVGFMLDMNEKSLRDIYCYFHICKNYDEMINVIKDIKPEYYKTAIEVSNNNILYGKNMFIMKKKDFINYGKFMFDVLFEFDRRHNFKTMDDIYNYVTNYYGKPNEIQKRIQGYLSERLSTIFYYHYFKNSRIKVLNFVNGNQIVPKNSSNIVYKKENKISLSKIIIFGIILIFFGSIVIFIIKYFFRNFKIKKRKYKKIIYNNKKLKKWKNSKKRKMALKLKNIV